MFRIYIACLAAYNNGILHGEWIDVTGDEEDLRAEIARILKASPVTQLYGEIAEEWAIHDHEGFGSYYVSENPDLDDLCLHVKSYLESAYEDDLIDGVICNLNCNAKEAIEYIDDNYLGEYESVEWWAEEFLEETAQLNLPRELSYYFDYQKYAEACEMNGDIFSIESNKGVYILWNR